jgi:predicted ATPase with chaperone activity
MTVNLAQADLHRAAIGAVPADALSNYTVLGELALDGTITADAGVLPAAITANARGQARGRLGGTRDRCFGTDFVDPAR